jgi:hypothetical protein
MIYVGPINEKNSNPIFIYVTLHLNIKKTPQQKPHRTSYIMGAFMVGVLFLGQRT